MAALLVGGALVMTGLVWLFVLYLAAVPDKVDQIEGRDRVRHVDAVWWVAPVAALILGGLAVTVATAVARRRQA